MLWKKKNKLHTRTDVTSFKKENGAKQQRGPGGTGGSEKLDSSNQARHTQGREKRRPSTINVVGKKFAGPLAQRRVRSCYCIKIPVFYTGLPVSLINGACLGEAVR